MYTVEKLATKDARWMKHSGSGRNVWSVLQTAFQRCARRTETVGPVRSVTNGAHFGLERYEIDVQTFVRQDEHDLCGGAEVQ